MAFNGRGITANIKVVNNRTADVLKGLKLLTETRVYAGVPATKAGRDETEGQPVNNAELMYIHEFGDPVSNIPARPVVRPAIEKAQREIVAQLRNAGGDALSGKLDNVPKRFEATGLIAQNAMRERITTGPFVPLKPATIAARKRRGRTGTKPLIDTGQLRRALTYVVRKISWTGKKISL